MISSLRWGGSLLLAIAACFALAQGALANGPELVTNGGFENPAVTNTGTYDTYSAPGPTGFGWTVTGNSIDHIQGYWDPSQGLKSIDLDGIGPGGVSQTLSTTANQPYVLTFTYSANPDRQTISPCTNTKTGASMNVTWGGQNIGSFTFSDANSFHAMGWRAAAIQIGAAKTTAASTVLAFTSTDAQSACGIALDAVSVTAPSCDPGSGQVTLYTGTNFTGDCATYSQGSYPDVLNGGAGLPNNTAESIKVGAGAFAVLHGVPGFGGTFNNSWVNVASDDPNLTDKVYKIPSSENNAVNAFASVSGLWVMGTGCTPGPNQVSLFALPGYGGGCVNVGVGSYDVVPQLPNDWAGSLKVGRAAKATLFRDVGQSGPSCTYDAFAQDPSVCDSGFGQQNLSSMSVTALAKTAATLTFTSAQAAPDGTVVTGSVHGAPSSTFTLSFYAGSPCADDTNGHLLGTTTVKSNAAGDGGFSLKVAGTVQVGDPVGLTARLPFFAPTDPACVNALPFDTNTSWTNAEQIPLDGNGNGGVTNEAINVSGESRWYKLNVTPGGTVQVDLSNLPANYDLALFTDIGQSYNDINAPGGLQRVNAELGASFSPTFFTPTFFTPTFFTPTFFTPTFFTPTFFTPTFFTGSDFSPTFFTPDTFSPTFFTPTFFTGDESAYESAQYRSLFGISVNDGTANEHVFTNVFNNTGSFYIRVTGRNGAYAPGSNFNLSVHENAGACTGVQPLAGTLLSSTIPAGKQTLILTDYSRFGSDTTALSAKVDTLAAAAGVNGAAVNLGSISPLVTALNAQADNPQNAGCTYAKNLVAGAIKQIVDRYRASNPNSLKYVVIVGGDSVVPYFRYPDTAGLGPELTYVPPVLSTSPSEASLQGNQVLSQDAYGSSTVLHLKGIDLPVPGLPVGRLVETPSEIVTMINAYLGLGTGVVATPHSSLVTGYDFMASGANSVEGDLVAGLGGGATNDTLISPQGTPPAQSWTASQLSTALLGSRHDLIYIGGHFSANNTLAADYSTTLNSTDLASSSVNLTNSIVFSGGCHSGYTIVNGDAVPNVTQPLDWTEAFAQHGATLIAGTGYQYGDTDFLAYSQKLYANFAHALRYGSGPVAVGNALIQAKKDYLSSDQSLQGIDAKALLESTLFGLPMLSVNLPAGRGLTPPNRVSHVNPTVQAPTNPGAALGLSWFDYSASPSLSSNPVQLKDTNSNSLTATYLSGQDGVVTSPSVPALPLQQDNVDDLDSHDAGKVLRGVGFRGGTFSDLAGITPLTGTPATEQNGEHTPFVSSIFYPGKIWSVNYFGGLTGNGAGTQLMLTPTQYKSDAPSSITDIQRKYSSVSLRLFYSGATTVTNGNVTVSPGLAAPPTIARVDASTSGGSVNFRLHVVGDPAAGIEGVWITYTGLDPTHWASLDLTQDTSDTTLWTGSLPLNGGDPSALRFIAQAVNGVGLVTLDDNHGAYYSLAGIAPALQTSLTTTATSLNGPVPTSGAYGSSVNVAATLTAGGNPLPNATVKFVIGSSTRSAVTNASGVATALVPLIDNPAHSNLSAAFEGDATDKSSSQSNGFDITKLATNLSLTQNGYVITGIDTGTVATLTSGGQPVSQKSVAFLFTPTGGGPTYAQTRITDGAGHATLGPVSTLPAGTYNVQAYFGPGGPAGVPALPDDPVYASSSSSSSTAVSLTVKALNGTTFTALTLLYVQTSPQYVASSPAQQKAETTSVHTICDAFFASLNSANKAARIAAFKNQLGALQNGGWLTAAQVAQLSALLNQL